MKNEKWKSTEIIVAYLEKRLSSNAIIQHDVKLPDLTGDSNGRQCDVVIKIGEPPRQTITIVEVQDRKSQIDINTFDGFVTKMKSVGAQHLIIVSKQLFPVSVKRRALRYGPTVRLVNFNEIEDELFPLNFLENEVIISDRSVKSIKVHLGIDAQYKGIVTPPSNGNSSSIKFEYDNQIFSPGDLALYYIGKQQIQLSEGDNAINLKFKLDDNIFILLEERIKIIVEFECVIYHELVKIPIFFFEYKQQDENNPLLWYAELKGEFKEEGARIGLSFKYDKDSEGYLMEIGHIEGKFGKLGITVIALTER